MKMQRISIPVLLFLVGGILVSCASPGARGAWTPVPTLARATLPAPAGPGKLAALDNPQSCRIRAVDLLGAWAQAGASQTEAFEFTDLDGKTCTATFPNDVQFLFNQSNVWFGGAVACTSCHGPDLQISYAQMDLSSYQGILAGSRRTSADASGNDILKGNDGSWEKGRLYQVLVTRFMPLGRPPDSPEKGPVISTGMPKQ
jgi:hypothetical protein